MFPVSIELELELIQTQMAQKPMLRVEVYARALRASQNVKRAKVCWARDAPYGWAGRGRVREWKALVWASNLRCRLAFFVCRSDFKRIASGIAGAFACTTR
jgi:hypothetical protein